METLQDYAYNIYTTNLSVSKKRKLIEQLEKDIDETYIKWVEMMNLVPGVHKAYHKFEGYGLSQKLGVLVYNEGDVYYINDGDLGRTEWDDMGHPKTWRYKLEDIEKIPTSRDALDTLKIFINTHPQLQ